jgi:hypothetical protein
MVGAAAPSEIESDVMGKTFRKMPLQAWPLSAAGIAVTARTAYELHN